MSEATVRPGVDVEEQFDSVRQQRSVAELGMWIFLMTELMIFSGMFISALVLRVLHPHAVATVAHHLEYWIGATNTAILIVSSFTMSIAIEASRLGRYKITARAMVATALFGAAFLALKSFEYYKDWDDHMMPYFGGHYALFSDPASRLFLDLYYLVTLIHAFHLTVGIGLVLFMAHLANRPVFLAHHQNRIEITALYWHFIDLIWIVVFPTLYLLNR